MKLKKIATVFALLAVGAVGSALAGQGENILHYTLNTDLTKSTSDNVLIRLYDHAGNKLPSNNLNLQLQEILDTDSNLVWGSTGKFGNVKDDPEIAPKDVYIVEVYSQDQTLKYSLVKFEANEISLKNGADEQHTLTARPTVLYDQPRAFYGPADQVPADAINAVSTPKIFALLGVAGLNTTGAEKAGYSVYMPISFFAWLPNWGNDISNYTPGTYTGSGDIIITATWL